MWKLTVICSPTDEERKLWTFTLKSGVCTSGINAAHSRGLDLLRLNLKKEVQFFPQLFFHDHNSQQTHGPKYYITMDLTSLFKRTFHPQFADFGCQLANYRQKCIYQTYWL